MSSASTKDLTKAINAFLPNSGLPLPDELTQVIDAYLEKHDEEGASDRLQEDLLSIWEKTVKENVGSYAPWLAILRRLLPALRNPTYLVQWWDQMTEPILDHMAQDKNLAKEAWANTLAVLTYDDGADAAVGQGANQIAIKLLKTWMQSFQFSTSDSNSSGTLKATLIRNGLLSYGKKRPKGILTALNSFMIQKEYRAQALTLLCEFVQSEPPHLHVVLETPLFDNILKSLQSDTSTTVVTLAITALTMLLPNVPSSLVPYLPKLFNIYARLLFWDRERSLAADNTEIDADDEKNQATDWEVCVFAPDADNMPIPNLLSYFTILYGLYPLNFVDYIRKPQRYLRHANMPNADDIEVQPSEIRQKSERFRQYHILHPNFYNLTLESEKTDFSRWIKSESSEVVTECTALCLATELGVGAEMGPAQELGLPEMDDNTRSGTDQPFLTGQAILARTSSRDLASAWRNSGGGSVSEDPRTVAGAIRRASQSSHAPSLREAFQTRTHNGPGDSPTLPPSLGLSASHTNLQDMITSNKAIKTGLHQSLANDSVPSLALSHQDSMPDKTSSKLSAPAAPLAAPTLTDSESEIQRLYKQMLLLSNDLSFERYMKQQHMIHIGELKRRQLKEAATEAETQNLIMINRNLRNRIEEAKRSELRAKKESENRRNIAKKWETDLSAKLKILREEQKKWNSEGAGLKRELEAKTEECEKLTRMVCEYETTELNSKQNLQAINDHVEEIVRLKAEVSRLIEVEQTYQAKEREAAERLAEAAESIGRAEVLNMKLEARDAEVVEAKNLYESQISDLNTKLQDALKHGTRRPRREEDPDKAIESVLAASRAKMADLQRRHNLLVNKCTVLQSSLLEKASSSSRSPAFSSTPRMGVPSDSSDAELSAIVQSGDPPSPVRRKSRRGRGFSDPELFVEGAKYNVTPPLDTITASSFGTVLQRPSTPSGSADTLQGGDRSPSDRFHGRGKLPFLEIMAGDQVQSANFEALLQVASRTLAERISVTRNRRESEGFGDSSD